MRTVRPLKSRDFINNIVTSNLSTELSAAVKKMQQQHKSFYHSSYFFLYIFSVIAVLIAATVVLVLTFTGILGVFGYFIFPWIYVFAIILTISVFRWAILFNSNALRELLDINHLYDEAFTYTKCIDFEKALVEETSTVKLKQYRHSEIPGDAQIVEATEEVHFRLFDHYECEIRTGMALWRRSNGRSSQTYRRPTGYFLLKSDDLEPGFDFSLLYHKRLFHSDVKLENTEFNRSFELQTNDLVKVRTVFTPFAMEEMLKLKKILQLQNWMITKKGSVIVINFRPQSWYSCSVFFKSFRSNNKSLETKITQAFVDFIFFVYTTSGLVSSLPLLDDQRKFFDVKSQAVQDNKVIK